MSGELLSRRQFLASAGGTVLASMLLPRSVRAMLDSAAFRSSVGTTSGGAEALSQIKHVVVLMQENRSFDHYFGAMPGVRGFADTTVSKEVFRQPDPNNPDSYLLPFHADTQTSSAQALPSNSHAWQVQHQSWNRGAMDGFVTSHLTADGIDGQYTMAYFKRSDIAFHWALADAFTICDGYHCAMMGPTWPNRLYLMTGMVDPQGGQGGPVTANVAPADGWMWTTYPELLTEAGVTWRLYQENDNYGLNVLEYFAKYQDAGPNSPLYKNGVRFYQPGQFEHDAANDLLPTVSWILPTSYESEHPDFTPAAGADFIAGKINAIASNPSVWAKTLFILIYDENDGFFDHVNPPTAPAGTKDEYITVDGKSDPIGLGFRVPCILVSPFTVGGLVCHDTFDHTSVIRLLEVMTGVRNPNLSAWRRKTVGDFTTALGSGQRRRFPGLPGTQAALERAETEVRRLSLPPFPGASQTFPVQPAGTKKVVPASSSQVAS